MLRLLARAAPAFAAAFALASCGGSNDNGAPSDLSPAAKAKWDDYCASRIACLPDANCPPSTCIARIAEEGPLIEFVDCQNAKACGANDDDCVASAGTTDAEREAFITRCEAAVMSYQMMPQALPDECYPETVLCSIVGQPLVRKQFMHAVDACLTVSCAELQPCLDAALAPLDCW
jgi:hypothetical protein